MINSECLRWIIPSIKNRTVPKNYENDAFNFRIEKAREQLKLYEIQRKSYEDKMGFPYKSEQVESEESPSAWFIKHKQDIVNYVNEFLELLGMKEVKNPYVKPKKTIVRRINYCTINEESKEDIVWIKFASRGVISVIGTGCDIYFTDYASEHTSSGRINKALDLAWYEAEVLIFPLKQIPKGLYRSDIESGIGNYLISKGVPILDYYSHNY